MAVQRQLAAVCRVATTVGTSTINCAAPSLHLHGCASCVASMAQAARSSGDGKHQHLHFFYAEPSPQELQPTASRVQAGPQLTMWRILFVTLLCLVPVTLYLRNGEFLRLNSIRTRSGGGQQQADNGAAPSSASLGSLLGSLETTRRQGGGRQLAARAGTTSDQQPPESAGDRTLTIAEVLQQAASDGAGRDASSGSQKLARRSRGRLESVKWRQADQAVPGESDTPPAPPFALPVDTFDPNITAGPTPEYKPWFSLKEHPLAWHSLNDSELFRTALSVPPALSTDPTPRKVALMFLTRGPLPLAPLWSAWLRGAEGGYSIYVHPTPGFRFSKDDPEILWGREVPSAIVEWGYMNIIDAERRLIANALLDPLNTRFVLLSETCAPLWNFTYTYHYLMATNLSFIELVDEEGTEGRGRWVEGMAPVIPFEQWRKGSQWFAVTRKLLYTVLNDSKYYETIKEFCTGHCYPDEHYFACLGLIEHGAELANRTVTFVEWKQGGSHPWTFKRISEKTHAFMRGDGQCRGDAGEAAPCHLFARKFQQRSLKPMLQLSGRMAIVEEAAAAAELQKLQVSSGDQRLDLGLVART